MLTPETDEDEFEPACGGWATCDFEKANHEAAHALVAHVLGLKVWEVRIDRPLKRTRRGPDPLGFCRYEKTTGEFRWKQMLVALAPWIVEGKAPERPPSLDDAGLGDEMSAAVVAFELEISELLYQVYLAYLEGLLKQPTARKKGQALSRALLDHGALNGDGVRRIFEEVEAQQGKGKAEGFDLDEDQRPRVVTALPHAGGI